MKEITKGNFKKLLRELEIAKYPTIDVYLKNIREKLLRKEKLLFSEELMSFAKFKKFFEEIRKEENKFYVNRIDWNIFSHRPPLDFQIVGIKFLLLNDRVILADDMGIGKSIQAVLAALLLQEDTKILIITLKTLKYNFENEILFYSNSCKVIEKEWESGFKFTIVHYDALKKWKKQILDEKFECVIIDECFTYETLIKTDKGEQKIGDIVTKKLNVKILSYNHDTKQLEYRKINNYYENTPKDTLTKIKFFKGQQYLKSCEITHNHKIFVKNENRYIKASELKKGDKVFLLQKRNWKEFLVELFKRMFGKNKK